MPNDRVVMPASARMLIVFSELNSSGDTLTTSMTMSLPREAAIIGANRSLRRPCGRRR